MKVTLIVQARSNSTRLKNKMFLTLGKYKILEWVILRLKNIRFVDNLVIATSDKVEDRNILKIAKKNNLKVFIGDEKNVLKRFYLCSKKFPSDLVVRVCADNPLIDKKEIERLILYFKKNYKKNDYLQNFLVTKNSIYAGGFGAEIFKRKCIKEAFLSAKLLSDKEHVTKFIRNNPKKFKSEFYFGNKNLHFPYLNFDVDTKKDLDNLNKISKQLNLKLSTKGDMIIKKYLIKSINQDLVKLFPVNRSLTGSGNMKTLKYIQKKIPIKILNIKSGTNVYDWKVPHEWIVKMLM
jgi:spore coat polysaccharide biosynthesis protein SpsF